MKKSYDRYGRRKFLLNKIKGLAYPYLLWSVIQASVELLFAGHSYRDGSVTNLFFIPVLPWAQFWFLYALFLMYVAFSCVQSVQSVRWNQMLLIVISVALSLFFYPIQSDYFALIGFSTGFIFFVSGVAGRTCIHHLLLFKRPGWAAAGFFLAFLVSAWYIFNLCIEPVRLPGGEHPFPFLFLALLGIGTCIMLAIFLAKNSWLIVIRKIGRYSLQIYLVHMLVGVGVRIFLQTVFHITNPWLHMVMGVLAALTIPMLMSIYSRRLRIPYLFGWDNNLVRTKESL